MKPLYTPLKFKQSKSRDNLPLECECCHKTFYAVKSQIQKVLAGNSSISFKYCGRKCSGQSIKNGKDYPCAQCKKLVYKTPREIKRSKSNNVFCSSSCAATYNNTHKTKGYRRSKLEHWIESQLSRKYPNLHVCYNKTNAIGMELDVYIPSLQVAFELNGIFHYEEIYGNLTQIQKNDRQKFQLCITEQINLCVIDVSSQIRFTPKSSQKFLNIITDIIDDRFKKLG